MTTTIDQSKDQGALRRRWQERCRKGNFSAVVLGVGTIRIFGKSGDAPVTFPRIESLEVLDQLDPDERWAIEVAQETIQAARTRKRSIMAMQPPTAGTAPQPIPVHTFDPKTEQVLILSLTRGG